MEQNGDAVRITVYGMQNIEDDFSFHHSGTYRDITLVFPETIRIGNGFLRNFDADSLRITAPNLFSVGSFFLEGCLAKSIIVNAPALGTIQSDAFRGSLNLTELTFRAARVTIIGDGFARGCPELANVSVHVPRLRILGKSFFRGSHLGQRVFFQMTNVTRIGDNFLAETRLKIAVLGLNSVTEIGKNALSHNSSLCSVILYAPVLGVVGEDFLSNCGTLRSLEIHALKFANIREELQRCSPALSKINIRVSMIHRPGPVGLE